MGEMPLAKRKVLYLLHGLSDDGSAWQRYTAVETYAAHYGLVVVMPSFGRSFYLDQPNGQNYFTYLVEELPATLEKVFGIKPNRENTMIAGNSMGGYGAFKAALLHPKLYSAAASFSGMLSLDVLQLLPDDPRKNEFMLLFGNLQSLPGSRHDPAVWLNQAAKNPELLPRLFISTGTLEDIYPLSMIFHANCQSLGAPVTYREQEARHVWSFWDGELRWFLGQVLDQKEGAEGG